MINGLTLGSYFGSIIVSQRPLGIRVKPTIALISIESFSHQLISSYRLPSFYC